MSDLTQLSARELAHRIATGELSSRDVVEAFIRRIERFNPKVNAMVVTRFAEARQEAAEADAARDRGEPLGPLHGVPISIKESFHLKGTPSTAGIESQTELATEDNPLVARLRKAGAIVLGKTNVPQLLLYNETDSPVYGRTNNPWDLERSPFGSSGGEGAFIAAGGAPLGLGTDIGGSIRLPAHGCGIHGLKPTAGRLPMVQTADEAIVAGQEAILGQPGPLARHVGDLSLAMELLTAPGLDLLDPAVPPVPWRRPEEVGLRSLRIGFYTDDGFFPAAPALRRAVREAAQALEQIGATVIEFTPPDVSEAMDLYFALMSAGGGRSQKALLARSRVDRRIGDLLRIAGMPSALRPIVAGAAEAAGHRRLARTIRTVSAASAEQYWAAIHRRNQYRHRFLAAMERLGIDVLICPPYATPALKHGASQFLVTAFSYIALYNVLGMPAGVVAATRVRPGEESDRAPSRDIVERTARQVEEGSAGLPIGVQVVARHWREDQVLAVMGALEAHFRAQPDFPTTPTES